MGGEQSTIAQVERQVDGDRIPTGKCIINLGNGFRLTIDCKIMNDCLKGFLRKGEYDDNIIKLTEGNFLYVFFSNLDKKEAYRLFGEENVRELIRRLKGNSRRIKAERAYKAQELSLSHIREVQDADVDVTNHINPLGFSNNVIKDCGLQHGILTRENGEQMSVQAMFVISNPVKCEDNIPDSLFDEDKLALEIIIRRFIYTQLITGYIDTNPKIDIEIDSDGRLVKYFICISNQIEKVQPISEDHDLLSKHSKLSSLYNVDEFKDGIRDLYGGNDKVIGIVMKGVEAGYELVDKIDLGPPPPLIDADDDGDANDINEKYAVY